MAVGLLLATAYVLSSQPAWPAALLSRLGAVITASGIAERFPCEACGCGCRTARQCWLNCCCHSDEERLDWADREGVEVPGFARGALRGALARRDHRVVLAGQPVTKPRCPLCVPRQGPTPIKRIGLMTALKCRGVPEWLALAGLAALSGRDGAAVSVPALAVGVVEVAPARAPSWALAVEPPPPRG